MTILLWVGDVQLATNRASGDVRDLAVAGDGSPTTIRRVLPDGVIRSLTRQDATLAAQVADQVLSLHGTTTPDGIRSTAVLARR